MPPTCASCAHCQPAPAEPQYAAYYGYCKVPQPFWQSDRQPLVKKSDWQGGRVCSAHLPRQPLRAPCPHCGATTGVVARGPEGYQVICKASDVATGDLCLVAAPVRATEAAALVAWNTRVAGEAARPACPFCGDVATPAPLTLATQPPQTAVVCAACGAMGPRVFAADAECAQVRWLGRATVNLPVGVVTLCAWCQERPAAAGCPCEECQARGATPQAPVRLPRHALGRQPPKLYAPSRATCKQCETRTVVWHQDLRRKRWMLCAWTGETEPGVGFAYNPSYRHECGRFIPGQTAELRAVCQQLAVGLSEAAFWEAVRALAATSDRAAQVVWAAHTAHAGR